MIEKNSIVINDNKFKSIYISCNFELPLNKKDSGKNALLALVLKRGNAKYKTLKELEIRLSELYASNIDVSAEKIGAIYNIEFYAEVINKKFIGKDVTEEVLDILYDTIYNPYLENGMFSEEYVDVEKANLINKINDEKNDKRKYSLLRLEQEMFKDTEYELSALGDIDIIEKQTAETLYDYYKYVLENAKKTINIVGNLEGYENLYEKINKKFNISYDEKRIDRNINVPNKDGVKYIKEYEQVNQSVLCMGLKVNDIKLKDMFALNIYSSILGETPNSKLFQNVREKASLAYFARCQYNRFANAIYIYSGINLSNVDRAIDIIKEQIQDMKTGNITEEEFESAKKNVILSYRALLDNKAAIAKYALSSKIYWNKEIDLKDIINGLEKVGLKDVIYVANNIDIDTIYLLGGTLNE